MGFSYCSNLTSQKRDPFCERHPQVSARVIKQGPIWEILYMGVSQNEGCLFGVPDKKDQSILGPTLGSTYLGQLPYDPHIIPSKDSP